jgi:predicted nucleic-acid-binding Zn-ribbon protein
METRCPQCGTQSVVAQDIEALSDSALLVKLEKRIQLCCQQCGWMAFREMPLDHENQPENPHKYKYPPHQS